MVLSTLHSLKGIFTPKKRHEEVFYSQSLDRHFALYNVSDRVYQYYIHMVNNEDESDLYKVRCKLTRNTLLCEELPTNNANYSKYNYGNLTIIVNKDKHEITRLKNYKKRFGRVFKSTYKVDRDVKEELNKLLGL